MGTKMKGLIRLNWDDLALIGGVMGGIFLLVHVVTALAVRFSGEGTSLMLSGVLMPVVACVLMLGLGAGHVLFTFVQGVRFGQTRRRALGLALGQMGVEWVAAVGLTALLVWAERHFAPALWLKLSGAQAIHWGGQRIPEGKAEEFALLWRDTLFIEEFSLEHWYWAPLIVLCGLLAGVIAGAVIQRFGRRGGWFLWGLWMAFFILFPRLPWRTHEVVDWLIPLLAGGAVLALIWSLRSLLRCAIT